MTSNMMVRDSLAYCFADQVESYYRQWGCDGAPILAWGIQSDACAPYAVRHSDGPMAKEWLARMVNIAASADTIAQPGSGSIASAATQSERLMNHYLLNDCEASVSSGVLKDVVSAYAKTDADAQPSQILSEVMIRPRVADFWRGAIKTLRPFTPERALRPVPKTKNKAMRQQEAVVAIA